MKELARKVILDLGCMRNVVGVERANDVILEWQKHDGWLKVLPEEEEVFRFRDKQVSFAVGGHFWKSKSSSSIQWGSWSMSSSFVQTVSYCLGRSVGYGKAHVDLSQTPCQELWFEFHVTEVLEASERSHWPMSAHAEVA